jgi:hypothetical protein
MRSALSPRIWHSSCSSSLALVKRHSPHEGVSPTPRVGLGSKTYGGASRYRNPHTGRGYVAGAKLPARRSPAWSGGGSLCLVSSSMEEAEAPSALSDAETTQVLSLATAVLSEVPPPLNLSGVGDLWSRVQAALFETPRQPEAVATRAASLFNAIAVAVSASPADGTSEPPDDHESAQA